MSKEENFEDTRLAMWRHIKEEFMDLADTGELTDNELVALDNGMGETARIVMHILGIKITGVSGDQIHATLTLESTESL
jgi:hypothetical protein